MADQEIQQLLSEHEPANNPKPTEYVPSDEERKTLKLVNDLFDEAKKFRKKYDEHWIKYYHFFRGKQWREPRPSFRNSEVINMVWQHIQSVVPIVTDSRPKWEYLPEDPSDLEFSMILNEVAEGDWQRNNWSFRLTEDVYDSNIYGTALSEMGFNPEARLKLGDIEWKSRDPFYCFPDPNSFDVNRGGRYFIYAEPVDTKILKREYPDKKHLIKADLIDLVQQDKLHLNETRYLSPVDQKTTLEGSSISEEAGRSQALKVTLYIKDDEIVEEEKVSQTEQPVVDPLTGQPAIDPMSGQPLTQIIEVKEYEQRLKYPNGRKICIAGGVLLHDGDMQFDDGKFPFAKLVNYIDPRSFWGISEIEQAEGPQKLFNKVVSFMVDIFHLTGNPIWIVDTGAGIDTDTLTNRPGLVVEKAPNSEVRRESGVAISPDLFQLVDRLRSWFNDIMGSQDVTRGAKPEAVTAASAINSLQEAAQTRLRLKSRNLDAYLQDLGQLYLNRVLQFKTAPEVVRITNNQGAMKYFKFSVEDAVDETGLPTGKKMARVRNFEQGPNGQMLPSNEEKQFIINGNFDVRVNTGSTLPYAKDQKFAKAKDLFDRGAIDIEELLKSSEYPNWEQVMERMKQQAMVQDQAAQAQAMQGAGLPPTGQPTPPMTA